MKALVSGGTGFIGKALARRLVEAGWEVLILTRPARQAQPTDLTGCQYVDSDLGTSSEADFKPITSGCDVVFHCGAIRNRWGTKPAEYERVNQQGTLNLINASIGNSERVCLYQFRGGIWLIQEGVALMKRLQLSTQIWRRIIIPVS